jgi:hypothetical protein
MKTNHITRFLMLLIFFGLLANVAGQEAILSSYLKHNKEIAFFKGKPYTGTTITLNEFSDQIASTQYKNGVINGTCWHYDAERNLILETYDKGFIVKWEFFDEKKNKLIGIDTLKEKDEIISINIHPLLFDEYNDTIKKEQICSGNSLKIRLAVVMVNKNDKVFTKVIDNWNIIFANLYSYPTYEWELKGSIIRKELIAELCKKSTVSISMDNIKIRIGKKPQPDLVFPFHSFLFVDM